MGQSRSPLLVDSSIPFTTYLHNLTKALRQSASAASRESTSDLKYNSGELRESTSASESNYGTLRESTSVPLEESAAGVSRETVSTTLQESRKLSTSLLSHDDTLRSPGLMAEGHITPEIKVVDLDYVAPRSRSCSLSSDRSRSPISNGLRSPRRRCSSTRDTTQSDLDNSKNRKRKRDETIDVDEEEEEEEEDAAEDDLCCGEHAHECDKDEIDCCGDKVGHVAHEQDYLTGAEDKQKPGRVRHLTSLDIPDRLSSFKDLSSQNPKSFTAPVFANMSLGIPHSGQPGLFPGFSLGQGHPLSRGHVLQQGHPGHALSLSGHSLPLQHYPIPGLYRDVIQQHMMTSSTASLSSASSPLSSGQSSHMTSPVAGGMPPVGYR